MEKIEARRLVEEATAELRMSLADLIALSSVWVAPEIYRSLEAVNGVWYADRRRANLGLRVDGKQVEFVGQVIDSITLDSNNYANVAFKQALGVDRREFVGFHICHIWPGTAHDAECFTNIANLVAIPAELSSLTDHHPHIVACLKFRAWELYGWKPRKQVEPVRPEGYPAKWRAPWPASDSAKRAASRRARGLPVAEESDDKPRAAVAKTEGRYLSSNEATESAIVAAFYLSKFDHDQLRLGNQGETIDMIANTLGVNRNTLKNYRDYFDSHTGSSREGWKVPLPPQLASQFATLMRLDEPTLRERVTALLKR